MAARWRRLFKDDRPYIAAKLTAVYHPAHGTVQDFLISKMDREARWVNPLLPVPASARPSLRVSLIGAHSRRQAVTPRMLCAGPGRQAMGQIKGYRWLRGMSGLSQAHLDHREGRPNGKPGWRYVDHKVPTPLKTFERRRRPNAIHHDMMVEVPTATHTAFSDKRDRFGRLNEAGCGARRRVWKENHKPTNIAPLYNAHRVPVSGAANLRS